MVAEEKVVAGTTERPLGRYVVTIPYSKSQFVCYETGQMNELTKY